MYSTKWGAALSDDSYYYISSARNLLAGGGFDLVSNFPPILPLLLSFFGLFKIDPLVTIRWLNAGLFALNIYLLIRIVYDLSRSFVFSMLGGLLMLISSTLIMVHSWAMSEALYITFTLSGILAYIARYKKGTWPVPLYSGLLFGLAAATRYIGISLLIAGGILFIFKAGKRNRHRIQNFLIFCVAGVVPILVWMIRNEIVTGEPTNRVFGWHLMTGSMWINMLNTVLLWFVPGRFVHGKELYWLAGIIIVLVVWSGLSLFHWRRRMVEPVKEENQKAPVVLILLSMVSYLVILILSRSFFDVLIPMDERLLSPILVLGLILLVWAFAGQYKQKKWIKYGFFVVVSLMLVFTNLIRSAQLVQSYHESGRGYASARDHISETYAYIRNRPDIPIYSNAFAAIYFWTGRKTEPLPPSSQILQMKADMEENGAYLVIFDSIPVELYGTSEEELTAGLVQQIQLSEATIYRSP
jgi:4-amino-4-deoxy-L-arabinose transferase-like glycosyltransferase